MEMGSLPEWFTACAELLAVCTALFLPQVTARRARRESLARMRRVTKGLLVAFADDRENHGAEPVDELESAKDLQLYLRVAFFALNEPREIALRGDVQRLYRALARPQPDIPAVRKEIAAL
ncbi:transcriptional regulator [Gordonibacter sp. 28C]|uniref:transcriptional regulator n=1 Tax=Gordonibacter sp. 28C TaxID=2078569 RepID=UPI000DF82326|nr:transcriptional regulator [Gordonibacter sp. 28C]RDB63841.1 transcriptional regulator [Gordonibacter sp. 28C]